MSEDEGHSWEAAVARSAEALQRQMEPFIRSNEAMRRQLEALNQASEAMQRRFEPLLQGNEALRRQMEPLVRAAEQLARATQWPKGASVIGLPLSRCGWRSPSAPKCRRSRERPDHSGATCPFPASPAPLPQRLFLVR